ncbi:permease [Brevibacterium daeguense]|uniref:Permease n=1 Tax=Brevibacterium daeguense TaxID=909936 RepID=A0ABP8EG01_9MICO|nr:hypothetical protein [Brevibacterium daeguense]
MARTYAKPWKAGPFEVRLPFYHYRLEWQDYTQGLIMCAVDLSAIPLMMELLGMPFEAALAIVILNGILYLFHHLLGDPVIPGWITPAIPLLALYLQDFPVEERVHALVAFQLMLGVFAIFLGATGLASKVVRVIPNALRAGIVMGAGIAAVQGIFAAGGRFESFPWTITICVGLAFFLLYSKQFQAWQLKNRTLAFIGSLGILPAMLAAVIVAPIFGEAPWPKIEWGISTPDFATLFAEYTVFGLGFPPLIMFLTAIPTVLAAYIVVFGDVLQARAVLDEANEVRKDENVQYNENRAHLIFGGRNAIMSIFGPDTAMCGPLWAAMHVTTSERYKKGPKAMQSIFSGAGSFCWGTNTGLWLLPIVSLMEPVLGVALALTLLIQGFVSIRVGIMEATSKTDLGIAGVTGAILATSGATWGFVAGILLCALIYTTNFFRGENDGIFAKDAAKADRAAAGSAAVDSTEASAAIDARAAADGSASDGGVLHEDSPIER